MVKPSRLSSAETALAVVEKARPPSLGLRGAIATAPGAIGWPRLKRVTLVVSGGIIEHVFYPVFPPYRNASDVAAWLQAVGAGS